jgi:hypothetical protein
MIEELLTLLYIVHDARLELVGAEPEAAARCASLLRLAEEFASDLPSQVVDDAGALQSVTDVRTEIGTCLIAADRLTDAGVASTVVADVLRRGTGLAERALTLAVFGPETVGAIS